MNGGLEDERKTSKDFCPSKLAVYFLNSKFRKKKFKNFHLKPIILNQVRTS